jgi:hypothetical protein
VELGEPLAEQRQPEPPTPPRPADGEGADPAPVAVPLPVAQREAGDLVAVPRHPAQAGIEAAPVEAPLAKAVERLRLVVPLVG